MAKGGNAFISSLFTVLFLKSHRWALYQRHCYDRLFFQALHFGGEIIEYITTPLKNE